MPKLIRNDITSVNTAANAALSNEEAETQKLIDAINNFISGTGSSLKGTAWDTEKERLKAFIPALEARKTVAKELETTIKSANSIMEGYLNSVPDLTVPSEVIKYVTTDEVDSDPALEIVIKTLSRIKSDSDKLIAPDAKAQKYTAGTANYKKDYDDYTSQKGTYEEQIKKFEKLQAYLQDLPKKDKEAYAKYENVISLIAKLRSAVNEVNNSGEATATTTKATKTTYTGGGYTGGTVPTTTPTGTTPTTTKDEPTTTDTPATPTPTPVAPASGPASTVTISSPVSDEPKTDTNMSEYNEDDLIFEDEILDDELDDEILDVPSSTSTQYTVNNVKKSSPLKKVGLATVGLAAAGAAGYAGYKTYEKVKENKEFNEDNQDDDNYDDNIHLDDDDGEI